MQWNPGIYWRQKLWRFSGWSHLQLAIEREFEIIGEALHRLSKIEEGKLAEKIPEYRKIIDFRNIIAHGYDIIDDAALWDFAVNSVPELVDKVNGY